MTHHSDPSEIDLRPAPVGVAERINPERIASGLASVMSVEHPDAIDRLYRNELRWALAGFDEFGLGRVSVYGLDGDLVGTVEVHWSVIVD